MRIYAISTGEWGSGTGRVVFGKSWKEGAKGSVLYVIRVARQYRWGRVCRLLCELMALLWSALHSGTLNWHCLMQVSFTMALLLPW